MKTQKDYMDELDEVKAQKGMNDRELAAALGVTPAMLSNWRTGKVGMTAKTKNRIISFFAGIAAEEADGEDPATVELMRIWQGLTVAEKHLVIAYAANIHK